MSLARSISALQGSVRGIFGDTWVAQRHDTISALFCTGLQPSSVHRIEQWALSGGAGTFTSNEYVRGGTSGALGIIQSAGSGGAASVVSIRVVYGALQAAETITGIGISATPSGATAVIAKGATLGGVSISDACVHIESGTATTGESALEAANLAPYVPGHDQGAFFTLAQTGAAAGADAFIGMMTRYGTDGFALGWRDGVFGMLHRRGGSDVSFTPGTAFNVAKPRELGLCPTGDDPSNLVPWGIVHGYLGVAGYAVVAVDPDQQLQLLHRVGFSAAGIVPTILDPHLTLRGWVKKTSGAANVKVSSASWNAFTLGPALGELASTRPQAFDRANVAITTGAERLLFAVRNNSTAPSGGTNRAPILLTGLSVVGDGVSGWIRVRIRKWASIATPTWVAVDSADSVCSYDISSTTGLNTGKVVYLSAPPLREGDLVDLTSLQIEVGPDEIAVVTVEVSNAQNVSAFLAWDEGV